MAAINLTAHERHLRRWLLRGASAFWARRSRQHSVPGTLGRNATISSPLQVTENCGLLPPRQTIRSTSFVTTIRLCGGWVRPCVFLLQRCPIPFSFIFFSLFRYFVSRNVMEKSIISEAVPRAVLWKSGTGFSVPGTPDTCTVRVCSRPLAPTGRGARRGDSLRLGWATRRNKLCGPLVPGWIW